MTVPIAPPRFATMLLVVSALLVCPAASPPARGQAVEDGDRPRQAFVAGLAAFTEALSGVYGDEGPLIRSHLATMRRALRRWDASISEYERAIAARMQGADRRRAAGLRRSLVLLYLDRGRAADALRESTAATVLDARRADDWFLQGLVASRLDRPAEAADALRESSRLDPDSAVAFYVLAAELQKIGEIEEAARARQAFVELRRHALEDPPPARPAPPPFIQWNLLQGSADAAPYFAPPAYREGFDLLRRGRYPDALASFEDAVAADPVAGSVPERVARGSAALRDGRVAAALDELEAAVVDDPDHAEAHRILGTAYRADGQLAGSVAQLEEAVRLNPPDERARIALAEVLEAAGRPGDAERVLQEAVRIIPASGRAQYELARIQGTRKKYAEARRAFGEALRLAPVVGADRIHRAMAELPSPADGTGDDPLARHIARVERDPNNAGAHLALGTAYLEANQNDEAVAELLAALLIAPGRTDAHAALGQAFLRTRSYADAEVAARRALAGDPSHAGARYSLATSLFRQGRTDEATEEFGRYRQMLAEAQANRRRDLELGILLREAREHASRGEIDQAIARLGDGIAIKPDDPALHVSRGLVLREAGRLPEAVDDLERALRLNADPAVHRHLVELYTALGRPDDAERHRDLYRRRGNGPVP